MNDTGGDKSVDERVIWFQDAIIGRDTALLVPLERRSCGVFHSLDDCTVLNNSNKNGIYPLQLIFLPSYVYCLGRKQTTLPSDRNLLQGDERMLFKNELESV